MRCPVGFYTNSPFLSPYIYYSISGEKLLKYQKNLSSVMIPLNSHHFSHGLSIDIRRRKLMLITIRV